ncbi:MAG: molybdenum cofactor guanylyltransferase, partial [Firmicutes bacterium]|nr:molybdenum cofactor guanylyltransferase [Bacillota bacterium]
LEIQIDKLERMGIKDIILVRSIDEEVPKARRVTDHFTDRGPLGGIHAGLQACENSSCLFLGVDVPLVPEDFLLELIRQHTSGITIARSKGYDEPLIAIYDASLADVIPPLIKDQGAPVRELFKYAPVHRVTYTGPEDLLKNCNTPEDYAETCQTSAQNKNNTWMLKFL